MRRSHHGLLHGDDLLTVDLSQSAGVALQSRLQAASGLQEETQQVREPPSAPALKLSAVSSQPILCRKHFSV